MLQRARVWSGGSSFVVVVKATDFWDLNDHPGLNALGFTRLWAVQVQREAAAEG